MNVPISTQLELLLLARTLDVIKSTPGLSLVKFYEELNLHLRNAKDLSFSAHWSYRYKGLVSVVGISPAAETATEPPSEDVSNRIVIPHVPELQYLRSTQHREAKHDPLLVVRQLFDTALVALGASKSALERRVVLTSCLLLAVKSGRASLLLHCALLLNIFKTDAASLEPPLLNEFWNLCRTSGKKDLETIREIEQSMKKLSVSEEINFEKTLVLSCGKADHGKLGLGDIFLNRQVPTSIESLQNEQVAKVCSMSTFSLAINAQGSVFIWGTGGSLSLANSQSLSTHRFESRPQLLEALPARTHVVDLACGLGHALLLSQDGRVFSWGNGGNGRLGLGDAVDRTEACLVTSLLNEHITNVYCGASHSLALSASKGRVYSWGKNTAGQCGLGTVDDVLQPTLIKKLADTVMITQLAAGWEHSLALTNEGRLYSWGCGYKDNRRGTIPPVLGLGHFEARSSPELVTAIESVRLQSISSGWDHCLALDSEGHLLSWGSGQNGKLGQGGEDSLSVPCYISTLQNVKIRSFSAGCEHSAAISEDGKLYSWGYGDGGRLGLGHSQTAVTPQQVGTLDLMQLRPHAVHCGDKFTVILATPLPKEESSSDTLSALNSLSSLTAMQTALCYSLSPESSMRLRNEQFRSDTERRGENLCERLMYLGSMKDPADNDHFAAVSILRSMMITACARLSPNKHLSHFVQDLEYGVECCEDSFVSLAALLQRVTPAMCHSLSLLGEIAVSLSQAGGDEEKIEETYHIDRARDALENFDWYCEATLHTLSIAAAHCLALGLTLQDASTDVEADKDWEFAFRRDANGFEDSHSDRDSSERGRDRYRSDRSQSDSDVGSGSEGEEEYGDDEDEYEERDRSLEGERESDDESYLSFNSQQRRRHERRGISRDEVIHEEASVGRERETDAVQSLLLQQVLQSDIEAHVPLSPALSFESLHPSAEVEDDEECDDTEGRNGEDDEAESFEFQQALLLSSIVGRNSSRSNSMSPRFRGGERVISQERDREKERALRNVAQRRGSASVSHLRDSVNTLASQVIAFFQQLQILSPVQAKRFSALCNSSMKISNATPNRSETSCLCSSLSPVVSLALLWEAAQDCTAAGFESLYDVSERKAILLQLARSPSSFIYIAPGVWRGLYLSQLTQPQHETTILAAAKIDIVKILFDKNSFFRSSEDDEEEEEEEEEEEAVSDTISIEDLVRLVRHLFALYSERDQHRSKDNTDVIEETLQSVQSYVLSSLSQLCLSLFAAPLSWLRTSENQELIGLSSEPEFPWGEKVHLFIDILGDCAVMDLRSAFDESFPRSDALSLVNPLLSLFFPMSRSFSILETRALLPLSLKLFSAISSLKVEMIGMKQPLEQRIDSRDKVLQELVSALLSFFTHTLRSLAQPPPSWTPLLPVALPQSGSFSIIKWSLPSVADADLAQSIGDRDAQVWLGWQREISVAISSLTSSNPEFAFNKDTLTTMWTSIRSLALFESSTSLSPFANPIFRIISSMLSEDNRMETDTDRDEMRMERQRKDMFFAIFSATVQVFARSTAGPTVIVGVNSRSVSLGIEALLVAACVMRAWAPTEIEVLDSDEALRTISLCSHLHPSFSLSEWMVLQDKVETLLSAQLDATSNAELETSSKERNARTELVGMIALRVEALARRVVISFAEKHDTLQRVQMNPWLLSQRVISSTNELEDFDGSSTLITAFLRLHEDDRLRRQLCWQEARNRAVLLSIGVVNWLSRESERSFPGLLKEYLLEPLLRDLVGDNEMECVDEKEDQIRTEHFLSQPPLCSLFVEMKSKLPPFSSAHDGNKTQEKCFKAIDREVSLFHLSIALLRRASVGLCCASREVDFWITLFDGFSTFLAETTQETPQLPWPLLERALAVFISTGIFSRTTVESSVRLVQALASLLSTIESSCLNVSREIYSHLNAVAQLGAQFVCARDIALERSSPQMSAGLHSPQGHFALSFWLWPCAQRHCWTEGDRVHLLSRCPEAGDLNTVDLVRGDPNELDCFTLSVHLVREESNMEEGVTKFFVEMHLITYVMDSNKEKATGKKLVRRYHLRSGALETNKWNHVVLEIRQGPSDIQGKEGGEEDALECVVPFSAMSLVTPRPSEPAKPSSVSSSHSASEYTTVLVTLNGAEDICRRLEGGKWHLYQNLLLGKMPLRLGQPRETDTDRENPINEGYSDYSDASAKDEDVRLADVLWVPSSLRLAFHPQSDRAEDIAQSLQPKDSKFLRLMTHFPPGKLFSSLYKSQRCGELICRALASLCLRDFSPPLHSVAQMLKSMPSLLLIGSRKTQKASLHLVQTLLKNSPSLCASLFEDREDSSDIIDDESMSNTASSPNRSVGSARNVAMNNKVTHLLLRVLQFLLELTGSLVDANYGPSFSITPPEQNTQDDSDFGLKFLWDNRLALCRTGVDSVLNVSGWLSSQQLDEASLFQDVVAVFVEVYRACDCSLSTLTLLMEKEKSLLYTDPSKNQFHLELALQLVLCGARGGGLPLVRTGSLCEVFPRRYSLLGGVTEGPAVSSSLLSPLSLHANSLQQSSIQGTVEHHSAFISVSRAVCESLGGGMLVWLRPSESFFRSARALFSKYHIAVPDPAGKISDSSGLLPATEMALARDWHTVLIDTKGQHDGSAKLPMFSDLERALKGALMIARNGDAVRRGKQPKNNNNSDKVSSLLTLLNYMFLLRSLTVQLTAADQKTQDAKLKVLSEDSESLQSLLSLACKDPSDAASQAFESSSFKGVQIDVLRNLLREGDVFFLEKLCTRLWKQFRQSDISRVMPLFPGLREDDENVHLATLAGEVSILNCKVRASSHFPSVRLQNVGLERMTGRWFYECTLLSDGLMQIGWANALFRCDPICGQGVGDHVHSWAYDGLRMKKWNVSCEVYGKRWKLGDVVGVLIDMDLLEMRFYLNGEDLGAAFEDFSAYELFPAFSLNVRQSLRVNFGQHQFLFPPNEIDGKAFRPVIEALKTSSNPNSAGESGKSSKHSVDGKRNADDLLARSWDRSHAYDNQDEDSPTPLVLRSQRDDDSNDSAEDNALQLLVSLRERERDMQRETSREGEGDDDGKMSQDDRPRGNYDSEEEEDEKEQADDLRYMLNARWQADLEERIRMEAEEDEDFDGEDDDDNGDEEDEDEDGAEDNGREGEGDADEETDAHPAELRRHAMIESLIGMGFPVDWALRAAEHCENAASESAAISWIIERMELEQSKMNEMENDSRNADDENDEETNSQSVEYLLQRHAAQAMQSQAGASSAPLSARGISRRLADQITNAASGGILGLGSAEGSALPLATLSPGSPARGEDFNVRRSALAQSALNLFGEDSNYNLFGQRRNSGGAINASNLSARKNKIDNSDNDAANEQASSLDGECSQDGVEGVEFAFAESVAWNDEPGLSSLLPGVYSARRKTEADKQEVLSQVSELDIFDLIPIVASCQFALCICYARMVLLKILSSFPVDDALSSLLSSSRSLSPDNRVALTTMHRPRELVSFLSLTFRHSIQARHFVDRLFPAIAISSSATALISALSLSLPLAPSDPAAADRVPSVTPFADPMRLRFVSSLKRLEKRIFPQSICMLATEDNPTLSLTEIERFVADVVLAAAADGSKDPLPKGAHEVSSSRISSSLSALQDRILQRVSAASPSSDSLSAALVPCSSVLSALLSHCLSTLETAASNRFDGFDWIAHALEKSVSTIDGLKNTLDPLELSSPTAPSVLFAYWTLRLALGVAQRAIRVETEMDAFRAMSMALALMDSSHPLNALVSPSTFSALIKISSASSDSLRFCVFDLASHLLAVVNDLLQLPVSLAAHNDELLTRLSVSMKDFCSSEFFLLLAKEKRLLQSLGHRLKTENAQKPLYSRYTRVLTALLLQWNLLSNARETEQQSINPVHTAEKVQHLEDFRCASLTDLRSLFPVITEEVPPLRITQVSSSSLCIAWTLSAGADLSSFCYSLYLTPRCSLGAQAALLVAANVGVEGTQRLDDLEADTLYLVSLRQLRRDSNMAEAFPSGGETLSADVGGRNEEFASVLVCTGSEANFGFSAESVSPNIVAHPSNPLTLRNATNKKWSTARANVRMTSGVHRWDVHIDRCVSKNIFLGVAAREARLDNYVGCDAFGWAFLANKAIWHNKAKTKAYGELFRTGDTVSVLLDLDAGTLSFFLNDRPLGVAVEGLTGPLYPAFSLYNEDDQITIAMLRSVQHRTTSLGAFSAEMALYRMETLRALMRWLINQRRPANNSKMTSMSSSVQRELSNRWKLWQRGVAVRTVWVNGTVISIQLCDNAVRSFSARRLSLNCVVLVEKRVARVIGVGAQRLWLRVLSDGELLAVTEDSLESMWAQGSMELVGSSARPISAVEIDEYDRSASSSAIRLHSLLAMDAEDETERLSALTTAGLVADWHSLHAQNAPQWRPNEEQALLVWTNVQVKKGKKDMFSLNLTVILRELQTLRENVNISRSTLAISSVATLPTADPINEALRDMLRNHNDTDIVLRLLALQTLNDLFLALFRMVLPFSLENANSTSSLTNTQEHFAGLVAELRDLISPAVKDEIAQRMFAASPGSTQEMVVQIQRHFSAENVSGKSFEVKHEAAKNAVEKLMSVTTPALLSLTNAAVVTSGALYSSTLPSNVVQSPDVSLSAHSVHGADRDATVETAEDKDQERNNHETTSKEFPEFFFAIPATSVAPASSATPYSLVLEVEREEDLRLQLLWTSHCVDELPRLLCDPAWNLHSRLQASYVGQFLRVLEQFHARYQSESLILASSSESTSKTSLSTKRWYHSKDPTLWESALRGLPSNILSLWGQGDGISSKQKLPPLLIRSHVYSSSYTQHGEKQDRPSLEEVKMQAILLRSHSERKLFGGGHSRLGEWLDVAKKFPESVSEWTLFAVFVEEALDQVQELIDLLYSDDSPFYRDLPLSSVSVDRIQRAEDLVLSKLSPAEVSLILQTLHATGILIGLALKGGVSPVLRLPSPFSSIFAQDLSPRDDVQDFFQSASSALRLGITTIFPQIALDLWTAGEINMVLQGRSVFSYPTAAELFRNAVYDSPLSAQDYHVQFFWISLYELSADQVRTLLRALVSPSSRSQRERKVTANTSWEEDKVVYCTGYNPKPLQLRIMRPTAAALLLADSTEIAIFPDQLGLSIPRYSSLRVTLMQLRYLIKSLEA